MRIAIWGTSGSGKSTLIKNLVHYSQFKNYKIIFEPIGSNPYFENSYSPDLKTSKNNSYKTEIWMLTHRFMQLQETQTYQDILYDRSLLDSIVFAYTDYKTGRLSKTDWQVFENYFLNVIIPNLKMIKPFDYIVYLKVNNKVALSRLQERGLKFELNFDYQFWEELNKSYEHYLKFMQTNFPKQFIVLWGNSNDPNVLANSLSKILTKSN